MTAIPACATPGSMTYGRPAAVAAARPLSIRFARSAIRANGGYALTIRLKNSEPRPNPHNTIPLASPRSSGNHFVTQAPGTTYIMPQPKPPIALYVR